MLSLLVGMSSYGAKVSTYYKLTKLILMVEDILTENIIHRKAFL